MDGLPEGEDASWVQHKDVTPSNTQCLGGNVNIVTHWRGDFVLVKEVTQKEFFLADRLDAVGRDKGSNFVKAVELMLSA